MTKPLTYECDIHFRRRGRGSRRELQAGQEPQAPAKEPGRVPRVARLMALALRFDEYLRIGVVTDYGELAELGQVTRPRISQIMAFAIGAGPPGADPFHAADRMRSGPNPSVAVATYR